MDPRFQELVKRICHHKEAKKTANLSRPFLFFPKMLDPDSAKRTEADIPVLAIGDSFFCGNPKSGNGLGVHMQHIHLIGQNLSTALK